jgi:hypothetical protein
MTGTAAELLKVVRVRDGKTAVAIFRIAGNSRHHGAKTECRYRE